MAVGYLFNESGELFLDLGRFDQVEFIDQNHWAWCVALAKKSEKTYGVIDGQWLTYFATRFRLPSSKTQSQRRDFKLCASLHCCGMHPRMLSYCFVKDVFDHRLKGASPITTDDDGIYPIGAFECGRLRQGGFPNTT